MRLAKLQQLKQWPEPSPSPKKLGIYLQLALDSIQRGGDIHLRAVVEHENDHLGDEIGPARYTSPPQAEAIYHNTRRKIMISKDDITAEEETARYWSSVPRRNLSKGTLEIVLHSEELRKNIIRNLPATHHHIYRDALKTITARYRPFLVRLSNPTTKQSPKYLQPCASFAVSSPIVTELRQGLFKEIAGRMSTTEEGFLQATRNVPVDKFEPHIFLHHELGRNPPTRIKTMNDSLRGGAIVLKVTGLLLRPLKMSDGIDQTYPDDVFPFSPVSLQPGHNQRGTKN